MAIIVAVKADNSGAGSLREAIATAQVPTKPLRSTVRSKFSAALQLTVRMPTA
jgi:hypothetical protein